MYRFIVIAIAALGMAAYKSVYGQKKVKNPSVQTTHQPVVPVLPKANKPEVVFGEPLTDEEWTWIQKCQCKEKN